MRRLIALVAVVTACVAALTACSRSNADPLGSPTQASDTPSKSQIAQHETGVGSPIAYGLKVPAGATQVGPLVRQRSARLIAAYQGVLTEAREAAARKKAEQNDGTPPTATTPTPSPMPSADSFSDLDNPPQPDITTALLRVDGKPGKVFEELLTQVAHVLPDLQIRPSRWSQYCQAEHGLYTGCTATFAGQSKDQGGVRITITIDPGNVKTHAAAPASEKRPVATLTAQATGKIDTSHAISQDELDTPSPPPADSEPPATPPQRAPATQGPAVDGAWPKMASVADSGPGARLLTKKWEMRKDAVLLLSGDDPAFALMVVDRTSNADAIARSYVLDYADGGAPTQDIVEDRTEISTTYTVRTSEQGLKVSATYIQAGRGNYVALFYTPAKK